MDYKRLSIGLGVFSIALGAAARRAPGNRAVQAALAFVAAVTALDVVTALGLDRQTGKALPLHESASA